MPESWKEGIYKVIRTVASPLRFFATAIIFLALIIVALAWKSTLPAQMTAILIGIAFFVVIALIVIVTILVICYPKKLVFDQEAHLTLLREKLGDNELPTEYNSGELPGVEATIKIGKPKEGSK